MSCQSEPILFNPSGGYQYLKKSFPINVESSMTQQGTLHTGKSPRLYSGFLSSVDSITTISTLISLIPEVLDSHQVCSADSITDVGLILTSTTSIGSSIEGVDTTYIESLIDLDSLKAYLIPSPNIDEETAIISDHLMLVSELTSGLTSFPIKLLSNNNLEINVFNNNNIIVDRWCNNKEELGILIDYFPTDSSYLEFYSSDSDYGPRLFVEYVIEEEKSISYNQYSFSEILWSEELSDENDNIPHYVESVLYDSLDIINVYAFNLKENSSTPNPEMLSYDALLFQNDIITNENLNKDISLLKINVTLNPDIEELDSTIIFSLNYALAFRSDTDPSGDNKTEDNLDGTENNKKWDWYDNNANGLWDEGEGEIFYDYGIDNCPDIWETGNSGALCDSTSVLSIYNSDGTEGNGDLDWIDVNANGLWDEGEGEMWFDVGLDGCADDMELGDGDCGVNNNGILDPNSDNYNIDPAEDDWILGGTEGNGIWNENEPFRDWGSDGLPVSMVGYLDPDNTEGNGIYDLGEPFEDTGMDGLFNVEESGYNLDGSEGNKLFDGDGEFSDCGEDNECNIGNDDMDPNDDNWISDPTLTEGNSILDWVDENGNGLWDEGEGEMWFDWGIDQVQDSLEIFQSSAIILPNLYTNNYVFVLEEGLLETTPELIDSTVSLWISKIEKINNNDITIEISVQSDLVLKGLQFQLFHTPFIKVNTELQPYEATIAKIETEKLFEDLSLYPKKYYSKEELQEKLLIEFSNDVSIFLDFDSLYLFLSSSEYIFSHQYSSLIMYIDSALTNIWDGYINLNVIHANSLGEDEILYQKLVSSLSDSIEIEMGQILTRFQNGSIDSYNGLKLMLDGERNNYSQLSIQYNPEQFDYNPRLEIMYTK